MNIYELVIDEEAEVFGIDAISLVEHPAIESNWVALKEQPTKYVLSDESKRIVMGPALLPDKPIFRSQDGQDFHIFFSKKTVRRAMELYFKHHNQAKATLEHEHPVLDSFVVESWIVEGEQDKSRMHGLDVPIGTWMVSMKIENDTLWKEYVSTGKVKGFSIEGFFSNKFEVPNVKGETLYKAKFDAWLKQGRNGEMMKEISDLCKESTKKTVI